MTTIYEVAQAAGVSPKTVSRVLNGDGPVNEKTRALVASTIEKMHYAPSRAARMMRLQKSGTVGMITGAISDLSALSEPTGLPEILILQGAQNTFAKYGKILMITDTGGDQRRVPGLLRTFLEYRVEGLILVANHHQQVRLPEDFAGRPLVLANCFDDAGTPAIVPDDMAGQTAVVAGLIARGHRRIGFITLPVASVAGRLRLAAYRAALENSALDFDPDLVVEGARETGVMDVAELDLILDRMLGGGNPPTALCCGNDQMAVRICALLQRRSLTIPGHMSVVGYDDYRLITEHVHPTLSSVQLPYQEIGARAAERLVAAVNEGGIVGDRSAIERLAGPVTWRNSVRSLN
jgi:LacI family transcriptional regulator